MDSADELFFSNFLCDSDDSSSDDEEMLAAVLVLACDPGAQSGVESQSREQPFTSMEGLL